MKRVDVNLYILEITQRVCQPVCVCFFSLSLPAWLTQLTTPPPPPPPPSSPSPIARPASCLLCIFSSIERNNSADEF